ncbi:MAG: Rieske (2Fe-2S) protein [Planctomycetes bacterium]|nr:Rieske (2Fe-2S) protein [Planctomycetota bacterium]
MEWTNAISLEDLRSKGGKAVVNIGPKQILIIEEDDNLFAIDNRCPHEGYPLAVGTIDGECRITCNWHNWKFDLKSGTCLIGEDDVSSYPLSLEAGQVRVDASGPSLESIGEKIMQGLRIGFEKRQYGRMARELTRLDMHGIDPKGAVLEAILWSHDKFEFGMSHAHAAMADWLGLYEQAEAREERIICLNEILDHLSHDSLRHSPFPYAEGLAPWNAAELVAAIDAEDEAKALAIVRGACAEGLAWPALEGAFTEAALAYYQDFGHALIWVQKTGEALQRLDQRAMEPLLLLLTRSLCFATREDLIPQFRHYAPSLAALTSFGDKTKTPSINGLAMSGVPQALDWVVRHAQEHTPEALFQALLHASAVNMVHFDTRRSLEPYQTPTNSISWLGFTHSLTFADAVRILCGRYSEFWAKGLLQMACFIGRNRPAIDETIREEDWRVSDQAAFRKTLRDKIFDHGLAEPIFSSHVLKTGLAVFQLADQASEACRDSLFAALNRMFSAPLKEKQVRRIAFQAIDLVSKDFAS